MSNFNQFDNFLTKEDVASLNQIIETTLKGITHIDQNEVKSFIIPKNQFKKLSAVIQKPLVNDLLTKNNLTIENAYIADQKISTKTSKVLGEVPYVSHKDHNRRKKIFIYLTQCAEKDGPIWIEGKPVTANSGDMIFFDTDTLHFAGPSEKGSFRRVLRLDCFNPNDIREDDFVKSLRYKFSQMFPYVYGLSCLLLKGKNPKRTRLLKGALVNELS